MSIRLRILAVLSVMLALACGLAFYGLRGINATGDLVVRLYDGPLMAVNHARSAHAELNAALLILKTSESTGVSKETTANYEKLLKAMFEDLDIVRERVQSNSVNAAREQASQKLHAWSDAALKILKPAPNGLTELPTTFFVSKLGTEAVASVDDLVELVAAYGFEFRNAAEAQVAEFADDDDHCNRRIARARAAAGDRICLLVEPADRHAREIDDPARRRRFRRRSAGREAQGRNRPRGARSRTFQDARCRACAAGSGKQAGAGPPGRRATKGGHVSARRHVRDGGRRDRQDRCRHLQRLSNIPRRR